MVIHCFEKNSQGANLRKSLKYTKLKTDLEENGYKCFLVPFEVGSRGHILKSTKSNICNIFATMKISAKHNLCMKNMSKISLLSSYAIFHAYTYLEGPTIPNNLNSDKITSNCTADYFDIFSITVFVLYESLLILTAIYFVEIYV